VRTFGRRRRAGDSSSQALTELAAASEREYLNDASDRKAAERYYADVDPDSDPAALFAACGCIQFYGRKSLSKSRLALKSA